MQTPPEPWIEALRHNFDALAAMVGALDPALLEEKSYATEWSVADVLSHIGSQAEFFSLWLDAGLKGEAPPGSEVFAPVWDSWNGRSSQARAADAVRDNDALVKRFELLDADERSRFQLDLFGMDLDLADLVRMRLAELAVHSWDIAVTLDGGATLSDDAAGLLVDSLDQMVGRVAKPEGHQMKVAVSTSNPERRLVLDVGDTTTVTPEGSTEALPELDLPAESLVRLVYGRLDPDHCDGVVARGFDLDELRRVFPGF